MIKKKFLNFIKIVWAIAVIVGGIYYVIKNYSSAIQYLQSISLEKLLIAFLLIIVVRILNVDLVQRSLIIIGWKPNFKLAFSFVSISQLGKYIPGGVWQFVARFGAYKENQIAVKDMGISFLIENIWIVGGSMLISLFFILLSQPNEILKKYRIDLSVISELMLALVCIALWFIGLVLIEYLIKTKGRQGHPANVFKQFFSQSIMWVLFGISFYVLFGQTGSLKGLFFIIGAFDLSFTAGYVAIFAPGGIGVREYVAVLLLSFLFSSTEIGVYTIVHRLLYTLAEFSLAGVAVLLSRNSKTGANVRSVLK